MRKAGLIYEGDFLYGPDVLPGWNEDERKAVKYSTHRETWRAAQQLSC
jgi:hypothetical protein